MNLKKIDTWGPILGIITATILIFVISRLEFIHLGFNPLNGHFQNFNALTRFQQGEVPYRDFPVYLGNAALLIPFPFFILLGGTLSASNAAVEFICGVMSFLSFVILLKLSGMRPLLVWTLASFLGLLPWPMLIANQSAIGIRAFLPFLAVYIFYLCRNLKSNRAFLTLGAICGLMPLWSNDYGIPTAMAFFIVSFVYYLDKFNLGNILKKLGLFISCALICFVLGLLAITRGNPFAWLQFTKDVSQDQFWYFNPNTAAKVFGWDTLPLDTFMLLTILPLLFSVLFWYFNGRKSKWAMITLLIWGTLGGVIISGVVGTFELKYFAPIWRLDVVIIPLMFVELYGVIFKGNKEPSGKTKSFSTRQRIKEIFHIEIAVASCIMAFSFVWMFEVGFVFHPPEKTDIFVKELGGAVPDSYKPAIDLARQMKTDFDLKNIPLDRRLLSQYGTMVSVLANSHQDVPDYIIHALGSKRDLFPDALDQGYSRVETINPDLFVWGRWGLRTSWPFFRKLFLEWEPVAQTPWSFIWKKRSIPLAPHEALVCREAPDEHDGFTRYIIQAPDIHEPWWAEVRMTVKTSLTNNPIPIIGNRGVIELAEEPARRIGNTSLYSTYQELESLHISTWTSPLKDGPIDFPIMLKPNGQATIAIRSLPFKRSSVDVMGCSSQLFVAVSATILPWTGERGGDIELEGINKLAPQMFQWSENGKAIYLATKDPLATAKIKVGDIVVLPNGKTTTVLARDFSVLTLAWSKDLNVKPDEQITHILIKPKPE